MPLVFFDYQIRKDFIAEVLCINKDKPETLCMGKCHLRKQLTKAHKQNNDENAMATEKSEMNIICLKFDLFCLESVVYAELEDQYPPYLPILTKGYSSSVFHPPPYAISI